MAEAATQIPIQWKTTTEVADRLLGAVGRPMLEQWLEHTRQIAAERRWPLKEIRVEYYQDEEEEDWENLLVVMYFDCPRQKAKKLFHEDYMRDIVEVKQEELAGLEREIFATKISYELESRA